MESAAWRDARRGDGRWRPGEEELRSARSELGVDGRGRFRRGRTDWLVAPPPIGVTDGGSRSAAARAPDKAPPIACLGFSCCHMGDWQSLNGGVRRLWMAWAPQHRQFGMGRQCQMSNTTQLVQGRCEHHSLSMATHRRLTGLFVPSGGVGTHALSERG